MNRYSLKIQRFLRFLRYLIFLRNVIKIQFSYITALYHWNTSKCRQCIMYHKYKVFSVSKIFILFRNVIKFQTVSYIMHKHSDLSIMYHRYKVFSVSKIIDFIWNVMKNKQMHHTYAIIIVYISLAFLQWSALALKIFFSKVIETSYIQVVWQV